LVARTSRLARLSEDAFSFVPPVAAGAAAALSPLGGHGASLQRTPSASSATAYMVMQSFSFTHGSAASLGLSPAARAALAGRTNSGGQLLALAPAASQQHGHGGGQQSPALLPQLMGLLAASASASGGWQAQPGTGTQRKVLMRGLRLKVRNQRPACAKTHS
jgi:hypothetical protein